MATGLCPGERVFRLGFSSSQRRLLFEHSLLVRILVVQRKKHSAPSGHITWLVQLHICVPSSAVNAHGSSVARLLARGNELGCTMFVKFPVIVFWACVCAQSYRPGVRGALDPRRRISGRFLVPEILKSPLFLTRHHLRKRFK